jgi:hypothetical protein
MRGTPGTLQRSCSSPCRDALIHCSHRTDTDARGTDKAASNASLIALHALLQRSFAAFHASKNVTREVIAGHSLLYTWHGTDSTCKVSEQPSCGHRHLSVSWPPLVVGLARLLPPLCQTHSACTFGWLTCDAPALYLSPSLTAWMIALSNAQCLYV